MERLLSKEFVEQMESELQDNQRKGDWREWHPKENEVLNEIMHHFHKLNKALKNDNKEEIKEFSADIANLCEKVYTEFGE